MDGPLFFGLPHMVTTERKPSGSES
jgi:hypothetical protein